VASPVITFLSDYGLSDDFVGVCHGVIAGICPDARVIDLTHGVPRGDVRAGGLILSGALRYLPVGVHLAVVDPGVGGDRRAVALRLADGRVLVGPDNGLLSLAGPAVEAVDIGRSRFALQPVSATFHGRDIFAPVAARLAGGAGLFAAGEPIDPAGLVALSLPVARVEDGALLAHAVYLDRFGNLQLDASPEEVVACGLGPGHRLAVGVRGESWPGVYGRTFADVPAGELLVYEDAYGRLAVAVNQGSAVQRLGVSVGDELRIGLE
jgi:S-adenosylmethionine hydrolase